MGKVIPARIKADTFPIKAAVSKVQNVIANAKKQFNFSSPANTPRIGYVYTICPNTGQTDPFNNDMDSNIATMTCSVILLQGCSKRSKISDYSYRVSARHLLNIYSALSHSSHLVLKNIGAHPQIV